MRPEWGVKRHVARIVEPVANFGLNVVAQYERPHVEFAAQHVRDNPDELQRAAQTLRKAGAIVLRGFYAPAQVDRLRESIDPFFEEVEPWRNADPRRVRDPRFTVQNANHKMIKGGWSEVVKHPKAVVNFRFEEDFGLVDLFHPERIFEPTGDISTGDISMADPSKEALSHALLEQAFRCPFATVVRNLYLNDSVVETLGFHIDGLELKAKSFLYLTDVESDEDGPYAYALGTHLGSSKLLAANQRYNNWFGQRWDDFPLHGRSRRITFWGRRGDLIISIQSGAHRGLPQVRGRRRIVLVHTSTSVGKKRTLQQGVPRKARARAAQAH